MATAIREQVIDAVADLLAAVTQVSGLTVERGRNKEVPRDKCPMLVVRGGPQRRAADGEVDGLKIYETDIEIEGFAKAATEAALEPALNDLYARAVEALEAWKDPGSPESLLLGLGTVLWAGEGEMVPNYDEGEGHAPMASFSLTWSVTYQTSAHDPYAAPA